jgi:hypothetical protein
MLKKLSLVAVLAGIALVGAAHAQQLPAAPQQTATIKRTPLQKFDVPGTNYETVIGMAEIVPGPKKPVKNKMKPRKAKS